MRHLFLSFTILVFVVLADAPLSAQYPGGYPPGGYPPGGGGYPGQYPPGQYPGGSGTGIPFPRRGKKKAAEKEAENPANLQQITGVLRQLDDKSVVVTADDTRNINFKRSNTTKFLNKGAEIKPTTLKPGDHIMVEATQDSEGFLSAIRVNLEKEGTAAEREKASVPVQISSQASSEKSDDDRPILRRKDAGQHAPSPGVKSEPTADAAAKKPEIAVAEASEPPERADIPVVESNVPIDETDPGAPRLKRGGRATTRKPSQNAQVAVNKPPTNMPEKVAESGAAPRPETRASAAGPVSENPKTDPRIEKAREAVGSFTESLPSYVCQEQIARFVSTTHKVDWQPVDLVSTDLVYENHKEQYRNIAINGKPVKKGMEELTGSWSTGEFGTVLVDLFSPSTAADFRYRRQTKASGRDAFLFDFEVEREGSHWHVQVPFPVHTARLPGQRVGRQGNQPCLTDRDGSGPIAEGIPARQS